MEATQTELLRRSALDIADDIARLIRSFSPLYQSRHWFGYDVTDEGAVTLQGHIKAPVGYRVLMDNVGLVPGVESVDHEALFSDSALRQKVVKKAKVPPGVWVNVEFGVVILSGELPARRKPASLIKKVGKIDGVRRVVNQLA